MNKIFTKLSLKKTGIMKMNKSFAKIFIEMTRKMNKVFAKDLLKTTGKIIFFAFGVFTKNLLKMIGTINFPHIQPLTMNGVFTKNLLKMTEKIIFYIFILTMNEFFMKNFIENERDNE